MDYKEYSLPEKFISPYPPQIRKELEELLKGDKKALLFDLSATTRVDSTGIYEIIRLNSMAFQQDIPLLLVNVSDDIFKTLKLLGVNRTIPLFQKKELAIKVLDKYKHPSKENPVNITLFGDDRAILALLKNILNLYGFKNISCIDKKERLFSKEKKDNKSMLIISNRPVENLLMTEIDQLNEAFDQIILSEIFYTMQNDITGESFETMLNDILNILHLHSSVNDNSCITKNTIAGDKQESCEDIKEFLHEFLHDISPSLNVFMNAKDFLDEKGPANQEFLSILDSSFDNIKFLIDELNIFLSPETFSGKKEEIDLFDYFHKLGSLSKNMSKNNKRKFFFEMPEILQQKKLRSNKSSLDHIFINLVTNAIKYSKKEVGIKVDYRDDALEVGIFDDGEHIDRLALLNHDGINYRNLNHTESKGSGRGSKIISRLINDNSYELKIENSGNGKFIKIKIPNETSVQ